MIWLVAFVVLAILVTPMIIEGNRKRMDDTARETAPGSFASLSQGVTHFQWFGPARGPVLVCVHGLTTPSFVWSRMVRGLAVMGFRVLTYDLYGRGFSDRPAGLQTKAFFLQQLSDLLAHEQVDRAPVTLIGYSMGGSIATVYAADNPTRIQTLILLAPAGMGVVARGFVRFIAQTRVIGDWLMYAFYPARHRRGIQSERDAEIGELQERELDYYGFVPAVLSSLRGILADRLEEDHRIIHRYEVPVLAIWGRLDTTIPLTAMGQLAEWSRDARHDVIEGAGHGLTYTHADEVLSRISAFLADQPQ